MKDKTFQAELLAIQDRAKGFLLALDMAAQKHDLAVVQLDAEQLIFIDNASGMQCQVTLVKVPAEAIEPVPSKAAIGEPGLIFSKPKTH